jgi:hypothetical protein
MIRVGSYVVGTHSYKYILNQVGLANLQTKLAVVCYFSPAEQMELLQEHTGRFADQLATHTYSYNLKSNRYWHPLQNLKRTKKDTFWLEHGLPYNYDINACAPTLLRQAAIHFQLPPICVSSIQSYIDNRETERQRLASLLDIPERDAKRLLNSLFNGAKLAANRYCAAYSTLGFDSDKMKLLQEDKSIQSLRNNVKLMWRRIEQASRSYSFKTSKMKWHFYFGLEKMVMDVVRACLDEQGVKHFDEHDGFRADREVDLEKLRDCIKTKTPFAFELDFSCELTEKTVKTGTGCCAEKTEADTKTE